VPGGTLSQNGSGKMNYINEDILRSIKKLGVTHVWYTGVIEHAHDADYTGYGIARDNPHVVKGKAGSPYAISDYYDIDPDIAVDVMRRMDEFIALVQRTHDAGMKVIIDFVPNHVARRYASDAKPAGIEDFGAGDDTDKFFAPNNDFYYITRQQFSPSVDLGQGDEAYVEFPAKASGNDCFTAFPGPNDWYETVKLNYGIDYGDGTRHFDPLPPTWLKMLNILRYWASKGVDGFRCDMAFMVPVEFWDWAIPQVKRDWPGIVFIAEIYDTGLYREYLDRGKFDYLYDKVNLYDTLRGIRCCGTSAARLTDCWQRVDGLDARLLNFIENHDEQRYASPQFAGDASTVTPLLVVSATIGRGPMMIYFGQELGEPAREAEGFSGADGRTTIFDYWSVGTVRRWLNGGKPSLRNLTPAEQNLRKLYGRVLTLCNTRPAISRGSFFDLMYVNYDNSRFSPHSHYAYLRYDGRSGDLLLIVVNFSGQDADVEVNIPRHAFECMNVEPRSLRATELLTNRAAAVTFSHEVPFGTHLPANGAVIWSLGAVPRRRASEKPCDKCDKNGMQMKNRT